MVAIGGDWQTPQAPTGTVEVPPLSIEREGWASTGRVGRDAGIAATIVYGAVKLATVAGYLDPTLIAQVPELMIAATGVVTVGVRLAWKWLGKYVV